jgi:hypothetical protein
LSQPEARVKSNVEDVEDRQLAYSAARRTRDDDTAKIIVMTMNKQRSRSGCDACRLRRVSVS